MNQEPEQTEQELIEVDAAKRKRNRRIIAVVTIVVCALILTALILTANYMMRGYFNSDPIYIGLDSNTFVKLSDAQVAKYITEKEYGDKKIDEKNIETLQNKTNDGFYEVTLKYSLYNYTGKDIKDFDLEVFPIDEKSCECLAYSKLQEDKEVEKEDANTYHFVQKFIFSGKYVYSKMSSEDLTVFLMNFKYVVKYNIEKTNGRKSLEFRYLPQKKSINSDAMPAADSAGGGNTIRKNNKE